MMASSVRGLLFPMRWAVASLPRGSMVRSACVPLLKAASKRPALLRSLREIRPIDRPDLSFEPTDSWVLDDVFWFGVQGYEGVLAEIWARLCQQAKSVLEVGGNIGLYSVIGGKASSGRYAVVEPIPELAGVIRANLRRNNVTGVEVLDGAAIPDATSHPVTLHIPDEGRAAPTGAHLASGAEIADRSLLRAIDVAGLSFAGLAEGRDLIKIDAEGIEYALLTSAMPLLLEHRPTIAVEVLPDSKQLAAVVRELARAGEYIVNVIPAYGSDQIVPVSADQFSADVPSRHRSKDVILTQRPLR